MGREGAAALCQLGTRGAFRPKPCAQWEHPGEEGFPCASQQEPCIHSWGHPHSLLPQHAYKTFWGSSPQGLSCSCSPEQLSSPRPAVLWSCTAPQPTSLAAGMLAAVWRKSMASFARRTQVSTPGTGEREQDRDTHILVSSWGGKWAE